MSILEKLSIFIFKNLELDYIYTDTDVKKVIYQYIYIGLSKLFSGEKLSPKDVTIDSFKTTEGNNMVILKVLGREAYFYVYGNQVQAITSTSDLIFNIEPTDTNSYELYLKDTFNVEFRYRVDGISDKRASKYSYSEIQNGKYLSNGELIPIGLKSKDLDNLFKMVVYDINTNEPIPEDNSVLKRIYDSIKGDTSTNTTIAVTMKNPDGHIYNVIDIFEILSLRLSRFYSSYNKQKGKVKVRK